MFSITYKQIDFSPADLEAPDMDEICLRRITHPRFQQTCHKAGQPANCF